MTEPSTGLPGISLKSIWNYVVKGASDGITATEGLRQFRSAGGHIRDDTWYKAYKMAFELVGKRESISKIPHTYRVPQTMSTESEYDWSQEHVMQIKVRGYNEETKKWVEKYVTAENDKILTKEDWNNLALLAMKMMPGSQELTKVSFLEYDYYHREIKEE